VLASGRGSNLQALLDAFGPNDTLARTVLVVSEREGAPALERARSAGVIARHIAWTARTGFETELTGLIREHAIDLICLAGFMRLLSTDFVGRFAGRIVNVHPSLLPDFPGLHAHRQALAAGAAESGCSVHFVDAGIDSGPVILQRRVPVLPGDDEAELSDRILAQEHLAYPEAVTLVVTGRASYMAARAEEEEEES
jgi:phosphoribosylglycinamide formyltransferase-1